MDRFDQVESSLRDERALASVDRLSRASDEELDRSIVSVVNAAALARGGRHLDACDELRAVAVTARSSWSWVSPITPELVGLQTTLQRLADQEYGAEWSGAEPETGTMASLVDELFTPLAEQKHPLLTAARRIGVVLAAIAMLVAIAVRLVGDGLLRSAGPVIAGVAATVIIVVPAVWFAAQTRRRADVTKQLRDYAAAIDDQLRAEPTRPSAIGEDSIGEGREQAEGSKGQIRGSSEISWWDRWLIRLPVYSLFAWFGAYGLHQNGWVTLRGSVIIFGFGVVLIAIGLLLRQRRASRHRSETGKGRRS